MQDLKINSKNDEESCFKPKSIDTQCQVNCLVINKNSNEIYLGGESAEIQIWDVEFRECKKETFTGHEGSVTSLTLSSDGTLLFSASRDKTIKIWDVESRKCKQTLTDTWALSLIISPDENTLYSQSSSDIMIWDIKSGDLKETLSGFTGHMTSFILSADGRLLYSGFWDGTIKVWDIKSSKCIQTLNTQTTSSILSLALSLDGNRLYFTIFNDNFINILDIKSGKCIPKLSGHNNCVTLLTMSPDGKTLYSASDDYVIKVWDVESNKCIGTLNGHTSRITLLTISPDGKNLFSGSWGSWDNGIKIWNVESDKCIETLNGHINSVFVLTMSPNSKLLFSGSCDRHIKIWDVESGKCIETLDEHTDLVTSLIISPDGKNLYSGSCDKSIKIWDIESRSLKETLTGHNNSVTSIIISPDGKLLFSGSNDMTIKIWDVEDVESRHCIETLTGHTSRITSLIISPDGQLLFSGSDDNSIKIWDVQSRQCIETLNGHNKTVYSLAISPDGKLLFSGSDDNSIKIWDIESRHCIQTLTGHAELITSLAISPDGNTLYSGSYDKSIKIWDVESSKCIETYTHTDSVTSLTLSPDGKLLFSGSYQGNIKIFEPLKMTIDDYWFLKSAYQNNNENDFINYLDAFKNRFLKMIYTRKYSNPIFHCIKYNFLKALEFMIEQDMIYYEYENSKKSPLIKVIESKNEKLLKILLDYLSIPENIKLLKPIDVEYLLKNDNPQIDTFLTKLPQKILTFHCNVEYIPTLTPIQDIQIMYKEYDNFYKFNYDKMIDIKKNTNTPINKDIDNIKKIEEEKDKPKTLSNSKISNSSNFIKIKDKNPKPIDIKKKIVEIKEKENKNNNTAFYLFDFDFHFLKCSNHSLLFLKKFINSENKNFIMSPFKLIVEYKWKKLKIIYFILAMMFWTFLILFSVFLIHPNTTLFIVNIVFILILMLYEFISFNADPRYYLQLSNIFDWLLFSISLVSCFIVYFSVDMNKTLFSIINMSALIFVYIKGFLYLKVIDSIRHLINMIIGVSASIISTLGVFFYVMMAFAFLLTQTVRKYAFSESIKYSFLSIFGNLPEEGDEAFDFTLWAIVIFLGIIITLILTNFLIAIMGSKYDELEDKQITISLQEQAVMIKEMEILLKLFNRNIEEKIKTRKRWFMVLACPNEDSNTEENTITGNQQKMTKNEDKEMKQNMSEITNQILKLKQGQQKLEVRIQQGQQNSEKNIKEKFDQTRENLEQGQKSLEQGQINLEQTQKLFGYKIDSMEEKIDSMEEKISSMENSLTRILSLLEKN